MVGALISGTGILPGTEIASFDSSAGTINLTIPPTAQATGSSTALTIDDDNGGTVVMDNGSNCYLKTDYRGDPHEFGALGDGSSNDTFAIESWLGAYGMVTNPLSNSPPKNFGPWIATIPGTYILHQPVFCPPNGTIQGDENLTNSANGPRINFKASNNFSGTSYQSSYTSTIYAATQAVVGALSYCRLSGVAVSGNGNTEQLRNVSFTNGSNMIVVGSIPPNLEIGNAVSDTSGYIPPETVVVNIPGGSCPCSIQISQNTTSGTPSDTVNFYGPDAVDVLGDRLTVDGFSLLQAGHYDLFCGVAQGLGQDGISVKDSSFQNALLDDIYIPGPCSNVRLIGNIVANAGRDGILFGATEADIEGGVIEESNNVGLHLKGGAKVSVTGMHIQGNGLNNVGGASSAGIVIDESHTVTLCGNHLEGNGGDSPIASNSSQIYFVNTPGHESDNVTFCGNVYGTQSLGSNPDVIPSYVYDADPGAVLEDVHLYETAQQPTVSIFSSNAQPLIQPLVVPQFTKNQIGGFTLSNDGTNPTSVIDVTAGSAADSTNSTIISTSGCSVDFGHHGAGGLDTNSIAPSSTYFIYVIAPATGNGAPSCMASLSSIAPTFQGSTNPFSGTGYVVTATGGTQLGSPTLYNVNPLAGVAVGDQVTANDSSIPTSPPTDVQSFTANTRASTTASSAFAAGATSIALNSITGIEYGMALSDLNNPNSCDWSTVYVQSISGLTVTLPSPGAPCGSQTASDSIAFSGARQIVMSTAAVSPAPSAPTLTISTGYYRLIGAVYTDGSSALVQFSQVGDTFYLNAPAHDIISVGINSIMPTSLLLSSVPNGSAVEAMGRCTATSTTSGNFAMVFAPQTTPLTPTNFNFPPGYTFQTTASGATRATTAYPFRLYTDGSRHISGRASASSLLDCMTDGWVFHRSQ